MEMREDATDAQSEDSAMNPLPSAVWNPEVEARVVAGLLDLVKNAFYMDAVAVTQVRVTKKDDGWLLMVKGQRSGKMVVTFFSQHRYVDALALAATSIDHGHVTWKPDKKPPWEMR